MIESFYLRDYITFKEVNLKFDKNFIVFTGPSGAGKSILMEAILAVFGFKEPKASFSEAVIDAPLYLDKFLIEEDEPNIFKCIREQKTRYFINNQTVSKRIIKEISQTFIKYLSLREAKELESENLLKLVDKIVLSKKEDYEDILNDFRKSFKEYKKVKEELEKIKDEERKIQELKEFAEYEIKKIEEIAPKEGEYEEMMELKKTLAKKEKIEEAISKTEFFFENEHFVSEALALLDRDSAFFDEAMNELRNIFEEERDKLSELEELDIEYILDRIEKLSSLKRRYGSIEEALEYLEKKKKELSHYENIEFEKKSLEEKLEKLSKLLHKLSAVMSEERKKAINILKEEINRYLKMLYLEDINLILEKKELYELGEDEIKVELKNIDLKKISTGEFNRVRLAFLAASSRFGESERAVLILDEIDANLSGKEAMSVANVLRELSKNYQILAISHQPQLSSQADMHFLVKKENGESRVKLLNKKERIEELARMISGEEITAKALDFAKSLVS